MSAVLAIRRKEIWQGPTCAFNVWLTGPPHEIVTVGLLIQGTHSADAAMDENAPSHRIPVGDAERGLVTKPSADRDSFSQHGSL